MLICAKYCKKITSFSSVQSLGHVRFFATPWTAARQASLSITNSWFIQIHVNWVNDAIQPSHPLSSPSPPAFNISQHQGLFECQFFTSGGQSIGVSASASVIQSLLQHHSSKESILWCSAFFIVQLSHPYMTTGKTIALIIRTWLAKWCLCFLIHCLGLS